MLLGVMAVTGTVGVLVFQRFPNWGKLWFGHQCAIAV